MAGYSLLPIAVVPIDSVWRFEITKRCDGEQQTAERKKSIIIYSERKRTGREKHLLLSWFLFLHWLIPFKRFKLFEWLRCGIDCGLIIRAKDREELRNLLFR